MSTENKLYPGSIDTRVALLEQSIGSINQSLIEIKIDLKDMRKEIKEHQREVHSDFRWVLAVIGALGAIVAHGFHWF